MVVCYRLHQVGQLFCNYICIVHVEIYITVLYLLTFGGRFVGIMDWIHSLSLLWWPNICQ